MIALQSVCDFFNFVIDALHSRGILGVSVFEVTIGPKVVAPLRSDFFCASRDYFGRLRLINFFKSPVEKQLITFSFPAQARRATSTPVAIAKNP
jgi:hypothetical protein